MGSRGYLALDFRSDDEGRVAGHFMRGYQKLASVHTAFTVNRCATSWKYQWHTQCRFEIRTFTDRRFDSRPLTSSRRGRRLGRLTICGTPP